jgi:glycerate kinase
LGGLCYFYCTFFNIGTMNILIAPDSFKDCLSARQVAEAIKRGIEKILPEAAFQIAPMADGGEGTVQSIIDATGGQLVHLQVMDPLMREITSFYGITGDGSTAVIEMASASGIELLAPSERDPWITSTYGTGQLIADALKTGVKTILMGIGGSATNDGGAGMAEALGVRFSYNDHRSSGRGGGCLGELKQIQMEGLNPRIKDAEIRAACDVNNPLTGTKGASAVYGPQKGADPAMVRKLDSNLEHFARVLEEQLGKKVDKVPGAGAAGGLGAGLMAFLDAQLTRGFDLVAETVQLEQKVIKADLVITGEGKIDAQTQYGKTPFGVAQLARKHKIPVLGLGGTIVEGAEILYDFGFDVILPIMEKPVDLEFALANAEQLLENTGERIGRLLGLKLHRWQI